MLGALIDKATRLALSVNPGAANECGEERLRTAPLIRRKHSQCVETKTIAKSAMAPTRKSSAGRRPAIERKRKTSRTYPANA